MEKPAEGDGGTVKPHGPGFSDKPQLPMVHVIREAVLDSSEMAELVDAIGDILGAAGSLTLRFHVMVECAAGEYPTPEVNKAIQAALEKVSDRFGEKSAAIAA